MNRNALPRGGTGSGEVLVLLETADRLDREFAGIVHPVVIHTVVRSSHAELQCPSAEALPELVERLARERLWEHVTSV